MTAREAMSLIATTSASRIFSPTKPRISAIVSSR